MWFLSVGESQEELYNQCNCVGHDGGGALDLVVCQSKKWFLEIDSAWLASLLVHSISIKSFAMTQ